MTIRHAKDGRTRKSKKEQPDKVQKKHANGKESESSRTTSELELSYNVIGFWEEPNRVLSPKYYV
jgi:hypothetical protein